MKVIEEVNKRVEELSQGYSQADDKQKLVISRQLTLLRYVQSYHQQDIIGDETAKNLLQSINEQEFNKANKILTEAYNYYKEQQSLSKNDLIRLQQRVASDIGKEVRTGKEMEVPEAHKFCPKCGNKVKITAKFCPKCGKRF
ncbi:zinc-ribbon domain-containing protein [archaeon]|nr:zinc-ribbon domain-containing protein [archaeon]